MIPMQRHKDKRRRGVILTLQGFQKIQTAKSKAEFFENCGNRYTLEDIVHLLARSHDTQLPVFRSVFALLTSCTKPSPMEVWGCREGFNAQMLAGISAEDCLFADLGLDPGKNGCQSFEATDFLIRRRQFEPTSCQTSAQNLNKY